MSVVVIGTEGDDLIKGSNDDQGDVLKGRGGDDTIIGKKGFDLIKGGDGNDNVSGNEGDDTIDGGKGDDSLRGGQGNDYLRGGQGDDKLQGKEGDDLLRGGEGDDKLLGQEGKDTLRGGKGNDLLDGGAGVDLLRGGQGMDTFVVDVLTEGGMFVIEDQIKNFNFGGEADSLVLRLNGNDTLKAVFDPALPSGTTIDDGTKISIDTNTGLVSFVDDSADDMPSF